MKKKMKAFGSEGYGQVGNGPHISYVLLHLFNAVFFKLLSTVDLFCVENQSFFSSKRSSQ